MTEVIPSLIDLLKERDELKEDYQRTCLLVAQMHRAAMNDVIGPKIGVVEDILDLREERDNLAAQNEALKDRVENQIHAIEKGNLASEAMECRLTEQLAALALQNVALRSALTQFLDQEDNPPEDTGEWREVMRVLSFCKGV